MADQITYIIETKRIETQPAELDFLLVQPAYTGRYKHQHSVALRVDGQEGRLVFGDHVGEFSSLRRARVAAKQAIRAIHQRNADYQRMTSREFERRYATD